MRLSVTALLVILALCYYEANAIVCPAFAVDLTEFIYFPDLLYRLSLAKYNAPPEAVAAKMEVKQCTDRFSVKNRLIITNGKILLNCTVTDVKAVLNPSSA
ncbi:PREDICTED: secretoglobin family 1D member isoform X2 [Bison bison bison]|uniref:Secretoglobin family 1D member isoform X2 n=1 Tax=Bison bison bison TaxID=43346 RepID=A0A6P3IK17_BISBB|nr:PREDICTED: secretoglobin family 1D member isoform X2 [Bison bison bison]